MDIEAYSKHLHFYDDQIPLWLPRLLKSSGGRGFIDVGCGDGRILRALHRGGFLRGYEVWATDLSQTRIDRVRDELPFVKARVRDACDLHDMPESRFDLAMSTQVIEHVSDDARMLNEMSRLVRPGGSIYLTTVFKKSYAWYFYRNQGHWVLDPTHIREYTSDAQLLTKLNRTGLTLVKSQKTLFKFPVSDFFLRRIGGKIEAYRHPFFRALRALKVPIVGYYVWELVLSKT